MIRKIYNKLTGPFRRELEKIKLETSISTGLSRASVNASLRNVKLDDPGSWEFSGFSQNGEDGIIDLLISKLNKVDKYFIEIGASNGLENNSAWLAHAKKFKGLMIEGDAELVRQGNLTKQFLVTVSQLFIDIENIGELVNLSLSKYPDLLSIDIDGNDYYISKALFENGFRPKIMVVEFNSAFGPERSCTIKYDSNFNAFKEANHHLYYGVSISGWKTFFNIYGYKFITIESNGVNAFFVDPQYFDEIFLNNLNSLNFTENAHQYRKFKGDWSEQFKHLTNCDIIDI